jgi:hypothetical protein
MKTALTTLALTLVISMPLFADQSSAPVTINKALLLKVNKVPDSFKVRQVKDAISTTTSKQNSSSSKGGVDTGGGHTVSCQNKPTVTLDFYNAAMKAGDSNQLLDVEGADFENILVERLNAYEQSQDDRELFSNKRIGDWLKETIQNMGSISEWTAADLKMIDDHKLIYNLPAGCKLEQGAAQERNGNDIEMYQNPVVTKKLSEGQKKVLQVHEALYSLVRWQLGTDSKSVRAVLEKILLKDLSDSTRDRAIANFIAVINSKARQHVCQATGYRPLFDGYSKFYKKDSRLMMFYGRTVEEAFQKMQNSQSTTGYIPCNEVGDGGNVATGVCAKALTLEDCK